MTMTEGRSCNMETVVETIPINISRTPGITDNVFFRAYSSPKEMLGIDLQRVYYELTLLFFKLSLRSENNMRRDCIYAFRSRSD
jgi:hypothetical protein